ncbi:type VI secretion system Vgr family protein [Caballeronia arationis]|uniref:phage baseplate assembly protein V n=1 Tax=Caballeronia arationis TaxID=1777142 RepID=UPI00074CA9C6|nr:phage baseplate assembly protein V [Caballeronia arationis]SAK96319.1 type VI secretion system Vgr family protein [Caballeronia arationis]
MKMNALGARHGWLYGPHIGLVVSVKDPAERARVQVRLPGPETDGSAPLWARVAVPFAGDNRGAFLIPDVGDEVLVVFVGGDPRAPVVVGTLWNGATSVPESIGGERIDRWTLTGRNGTRIAIVEAADGQEKVEIETPNGVTATLTDAAGGSITLDTGTGSTITANTAGVSVQSSGAVSVTATTVSVSASETTVNSAMATFSNVVQCQTLSATSVVSQHYSIGTNNLL